MPDGAAILKIRKWLPFGHSEIDEAQNLIKFFPSQLSTMIKVTRKPLQKFSHNPDCRDRQTNTRTKVITLPPYGSNKTRRKAVTKCLY